MMTSPPTNVPMVIVARTPTDPEFHSEPLQLTTSTSTSEDGPDFDCDTSVSSMQHSHPDFFRIDPHNRTHTVRVNVGGEDFSFPQSAFSKFLGLPWKCSSDGTFHLNSSAAVFEVLLDYILFGTMPAYDTLSNEEFEEFETIALGLGGLTALIDHFGRKDSYLTKELRQGWRPRRSSSSRHFLINPEDSSSPSPNSISATRCARFLGLFCGVAETIRRRRPRPSAKCTSSGDSTSADKKRVKLTHEGCSQQSVF